NENLTRAGFQVLTAAGVDEMRQQLAQHSPDLSILNSMKPGDDGFTLCQHIRRDSQVPINMLTPASDESDPVIRLELA
ncbi:response regulator, partial [Aeromonas media]